MGTPGALKAIDDAGQTPVEFLHRHREGDWGDLGKDDKETNDEALEKGGRLFSAFHTRAGVKLWVITEANRVSTCILLPDEY